MEYDSKVIHRFAEGLYAQARTIIVVYVVLGGIIGAGIGIGLHEVFHSSARANRTHDALVLQAWLLGAVPVLVLLYVACHRASALKMQAQQALCLAKIEENTRPRT